MSQTKRKPATKKAEKVEALCFHGRPACAFCGLNASQTEQLPRDKKSRPKPPPCACCGERLARKNLLDQYVLPCRTCERSGFKAGELKL